MDQKIWKLFYDTVTKYNQLAQQKFNADIFIFLKMGQPRPLFSFIFGLFKQTLQFLQQLYVKKCPSSIRCRDSNPRPSECESLPITTRPGLPPPDIFIYNSYFSFSHYANR